MSKNDLRIKIKMKAFDKAKRNELINFVLKKGTLLRAQSSVHIQRNFQKERTNKTVHGALKQMSP